jgi:hypothetical protein
VKLLVCIGRDCREVRFPLEEKGGIVEIPYQRVQLLVEALEEAADLVDEDVTLWESRE